MLENWLNPIQKNAIDLSIYKKNSLFYNLKIYTDHLPELKGVNIAIIGFNNDANHIRKELYATAWRFGNLRVADIGNIKNNKEHFVTQLLTELIDGGILPIVIGNNKMNISSQFLAHKGIRPYTNLAFINKDIPINFEDDTNELYKLLNKHKNHILNISFLAYQIHFCSLEVDKWLNEMHFEGLRLGAIKSNIENAEPFIRDADMLSLDLNAIKSADCPASGQSSPSGLSSEEVCQLMRYAGMSDKMNSLSIWGYKPKQKDHLTAQLISQMIWYFIEGFYFRKNDFPNSAFDMIEYVVDIQDFEAITFWKSAKSGRWWMQVPYKKTKKIQRHFLIPCSYSDYKNACNNELSTRMLNAIQRFG